MTQKIDNRKTELKKQRDLIIGLNNVIENDDFRPSESQKITIDYICQHGQFLLKEIERLKKLRDGLYNI